MLSLDVLNDLWNSAVRGLQQKSFLGINEKNFHATTPDIPFGDEEVRQAAAFLRQQCMQAQAIRVQYLNVMDHILIAGRTEIELNQGREAMVTGLDQQIPGATLTVLD